jgi:hypothetical protein
MAFCALMLELPRNQKKPEWAAAAFGGGHTLRFCDLGMILAWGCNRVSDGGHSAFVMNKDRLSGKGGNSPLKAKAGLE